MNLITSFDARKILALKEGEDYVLIPETSTHTEGWYLTSEGEARVRNFLWHRYPGKRLNYSRLGLEEWMDN